MKNKYVRGFCRILPLIAFFLCFLSGAIWATYKFHPLLIAAWAIVLLVLEIEVLFFNELAKMEFSRPEQKYTDFRAHKEYSVGIGIFVTIVTPLFGVTVGNIKVFGLKGILLACQYLILGALAIVAFGLLVWGIYHFFFKFLYNLNLSQAKKILGPDKVLTDPEDIRAYMEAEKRQGEKKQGEKSNVFSNVV